MQDLQRTPIEVQPSYDDIQMWLELRKTILFPGTRSPPDLPPHQSPTGAVPQRGGHAPLTWGARYEGNQVANHLEACIDLYSLMTTEDRLFVPLFRLFHRLVPDQ